MTTSERGLVVADYLPPAARRVLRDAGCSFVDAEGHGYLHGLLEEASIEPDAQPTAALARRLLASGALHHEVRFAIRTSVSEEGKVLAHPVELLEWLTTVPEARTMHSGVNTYLYCSDPDDILATLPFHARPTPDDLPGAIAARGTALIGVVGLALASWRELFC